MLELKPMLIFEKLIVKTLIGKDGLTRRSAKQKEVAKDNVE